MTTLCGRRSPDHRGFALIVVLVAIVVCAAGAVALVRVRTTHALADSVERRTEVADDVVRGLERFMAAWLASDADSVVLPPDATVAALVVLNDNWAADATVRARIVAFDQMGMVPWTESAGSLLASVEDSVRAARRRADSLSPIGLDVLPIEPTGDGVDAYPSALASPAIQFGSDAPQPAPALSEGPTVEKLPPEIPDLVRPAVGARFATHGASTATFNLNTTPRDLLERAMHRAGRGGLDVVLKARESGTLSVGEGTASSSGGQRARTGGVRFVGASDAWAFLVEVSVDELTRRWWIVWVREPGQSWRLQQRLEVGT